MSFTFIKQRYEIKMRVRAKQGNKTLELPSEAKRFCKKYTSYEIVWHTLLFTLHSTVCDMSKIYFLIHFFL